MTKERRPRTEILPWALKLVEKLRPFCERIELAGSLRREKPEVGDVEIVAIPKIGVTHLSEVDVFGRETVTDSKASMLWAGLDEIVDECYTKRGEKYRQFGLDGIQVDLFTAEKGNWGWIYLIRTGSAEFSHRIAAALNLNGYTSKEGYITRDPRRYEPKRIETPEEEDVFRLLGRPWVDPKLRE